MKTEIKHKDPRGKDRVWILKSIAELLHKHWITQHLNLKIVQWLLRCFQQLFPSCLTYNSDSMIFMNKRRPDMASKTF